MVPIGILMPEMRYVLPDVLVKVAVADPPIAERSAMTDEMLLLVSVTVHWRTVVVELLAGTVAGVKVQEAITGGAGGSATARDAVVEPVPAEASVAVIESDLLPAVADEGTVMGPSVQVLPDVFVSASVAPPPIEVRLAVTDVILALASVAVQVRVVVSIPSLFIEDGEKVHAETAGFGSVTVIVAVPEAAREPVSVAVMMMG